MKTGSLYLADRLMLPRVFVARTPAERMRGLLGRCGLPLGEGMLIMRCGGIHTLFMAFAIDVIFVDRAMRVLKTVRNVTPFRLVFAGLSAGAVIEVQSGWLDMTGLAQGDQLRLVMDEST